jgi:hypothetical protein
MKRKYEINYANTLVQMSVSFCKIDSEEKKTYIIPITVDFSNNQIFFEGEKNPDIDYYDLQEEILCYIRPDLADQPNFEFFEQFNEMKASLSEEKATDTIEEIKEEGYND